jgi:hypothetical protein
MEHPTDEQLRQWKDPSEDHFIERKSSGDAKDWLKTVVAFANSAPLERCAVLYIGVRDNGTVEEAVNLDTVQKTLERRLAEAYPRIAYATRVLTEGVRQYLCVIVPGSPERPHFAGPAFVRAGSQTVNASAQQYERLIAERNNKVYAILRCQGKHVSVVMLRNPNAVQMLGRVSSQSVMQIVDCLTSTLTLRDHYGTVQKISLDRVQVLEDQVYKDAITLEIRES